MEKRKKPSSTTRTLSNAQMGKSQQSPFLPNKLAQVRQVSRAEKAQLRPLIPDAITNASLSHIQQNPHENLHNAILRKSQQENRNGANSVSSSKGQTFFEVHKRGQRGYHNIPEQMLPNLGNSSQVLHQDSYLDAKEDESNRSSMQFSYYGRRQAAAQEADLVKQSPIPTAQLISAIGGHTKLIGIQKTSITQTQPPPNRRIARRDSEPMPPIVFADNEDTLTQKRVFKEQRGAEYDLEERMNHNLMKQFKGMCKSDSQNEVTDFENGQNQISSSIQLRQGVNPLIYNFIKDADGSMGSQDSNLREMQHPLPNKLARIPPATVAGGARTIQRTNERVDSSQTRKSKMSRTTQSFMPSNQLPPKARESLKTPLVSNVRSKQFLKNKIPPTASTVAKNRIQAQVNFSSNHHQTEGSTALVTTNASSDVVYKKGARSISRKNESSQQRSQGVNQSIKQAAGYSNVSNTIINRQLVFAGPLTTSCEHNQHRNKCVACKKHQLDGHDHSVSSTQNRNILKFNANYRPNGLCRKHGKKRCDNCSRVDSEDSARISLSSQGSNMVSNDLFKMHRGAPKSDIGFNTNVYQDQSKEQQMTKASSKFIAVSQTQASRNSTRRKSQSSRQKIRSLQREEMLSLGREQSNYSVNQTMVVDSRKSAQFKQMKEAQIQLDQFRKSANRPEIPKPQNLTISKVAINMPDDFRRNLASVRNLGQQAQSHSQGRQESHMTTQGYEPQNKIPRIFSSKSNMSAMQRLQKQKTLQKSNPGDLIDDKIKKITKEWENCDPHDESFWQKLQDENAEQGRMETLRAMQVKNQQLNVLEKQSEVFRELRMEEDMNSEMASMFGHVSKSRLRSSSGNRGPNEYQSQRSNIPSKSGMGRNTKGRTAQVNIAQNIQSVRSLRLHGGNEHILTEIDVDSVENTVRSRLPHFHMNVAQSAVLTDYDISDEVPQVKIQSEVVFKNTVDNVNEDKNIDDLTRTKKQMKYREQTQVDEDFVYWTALQTEQKAQKDDEGVEIGEIVRMNKQNYQTNLVKETEEKDDSSSESQTPLDRVTKCNITSYDVWLDEQAQKEDQRRSSLGGSPKSSISTKTQIIEKSNESQAFKGLNSSSHYEAMNRPKTQGVGNKQNYSRNEEFKTFCKKSLKVDDTTSKEAEQIADENQNLKEVEVILESIYIVGTGEEIKPNTMQQTTKNPDLKPIQQNSNQVEQSGTALDDYITEENFSYEPKSPHKESIQIRLSTDEMIYSVSAVGVLSSKSKPMLKNLTLNRSRASLLISNVIQEELTEVLSPKDSPVLDFVQAKETILSDSPLQEISPLSPPTRKNQDFEDEPYGEISMKDALKVQDGEKNYVKNFNSETLQPNHQSVTGINQHVQDFLQFEDSSDSDIPQ